MVKNGLGSNEGTAWCGKTSEKNPHVGRPAAGFEPQSSECKVETPPSWPQCSVALIVSIIFIETSTRGCEEVRSKRGGLSQMFCISADCRDQK